MMETKKENKNYICSLAFFTSCFVIILLVAIIHIFVKDELDVSYILSTFIGNLDEFTPERAEKLSYIFSVFLYPLVFFGLYKFFTGCIKNFSDKFLKIITAFEIIGAIAVSFIFTLFSSNTHRIYNLNFAPIYVVIIGLFLLLAGFSFYNRNKKLNLIISVLVYIVTAIYIFQIFRIYNSLFYAFSFFDIVHYEVYLYPIYKTISGMTPGVDFYNLYGFYPYIYSLFFNTDNISISRINLVNALLAVFIFLSLAIVIYTNIKNKLLAFIIYCVALYYPLLSNFRIEQYPSYYLQYFPHRVLFPMLTVALITIYLKINNKRTNFKFILKYFGFLMCSFALFWNLESGIASLAGWTSMNLYLGLKKEKISEIKKEILISILCSIISVLLAMFGILVLTYLRSGQLINPLGLFYGHFVFYDKGFLMVKMDILKQPFVLVLLVYMISMAQGIKSAADKCITNTDVLKFTISVIGFVLFLYYQGRSLSTNLLVCSWPAYILLGIFISDYYDLYLKYKNSEKKTSLVNYLSNAYLLKFLLLYIFTSIVAINCFIYMQIMPDRIVNTNLFFAKHSQQEINAKLFEKDKKYDFITHDSTYYYMYLKQPNLMPFSNIVDCFFISDLKKIKEYLKLSENKLVLDIYTKLQFEDLLKNYKLEKNNEFMYVYKRIK